MFGADDQPHFMSREKYATQERIAESEKEIQTQAFGPSTTQDVEDLDRLLARPTASQLEYGYQGSQSQFSR